MVKAVPVLFTISSDLSQRRQRCNHKVVKPKLFKGLEGGEWFQAPGNGGAITSRNSWNTEPLSSQGQGIGRSQKACDLKSGNTLDFLLPESEWLTALPPGGCLFYLVIHP